MSSSSMQRYTEETEARQECSFSLEHWPALVDHLAWGPDYVLVLGKDGEILEANLAFKRRLGADCQVGCMDLLHALTEGSKAKLREILSGGSSFLEEVELEHRVPGGARCVAYSVRASGDRWVLVGRDRGSVRGVPGRLEMPVEEHGSRSEGPDVQHPKERALADQDALTGLADRNKFEAVRDLMNEEFLKEGRGFSIISIDVDHFKELNDFYGHPVGDLVLERIARILEDNLREGDFVARLGGEEFAILGPDLQQDEALEVAERLRNAVEKGKMPENVRGVTVSVGVASAEPPPGEALPDFLALADNACTQAKRSGRNCVRCAG